MDNTPLHYIPSVRCQAPHNTSSKNVCGNRGPLDGFLVVEPYLQPGMLIRVNSGSMKSSTQHPVSVKVRRLVYIIHQTPSIPRKRGVDYGNPTSKQDEQDDR